MKCGARGHSAGAPSLRQLRRDRDLRGVARKTSAAGTLRGPPSRVACACVVFAQAASWVDAERSDDGLDLLSIRRNLIRLVRAGAHGR
jgi:hypothetical protein